MGLNATESLLRKAEKEQKYILNCLLLTQTVSAIDF
jgi:hypothetical protein